MADNDQDRLEEILETILKHPKEEWNTLLDEFCRDWPHLRPELESLLSTHRQHPDLLNDLQRQVLKHVAKDSDQTAEVLPSLPRRYAVERLLGEGGMGRVYLARDERLHRRVAVKVLRASLGPTHQARFQAEADAQAMLEHPNIARLYDATTTDDREPCLVMEYIDGAPIDEYCDSQRLGLRRRVQLFVDVCTGVAAAHDQGIIHRDLKPSNILVTHDGTPKLLDFGLAKLAADAQAEPLTRTGEIIGTINYMSPEQASGQEVDETTDVYSLGVVLYEIVTGILPYDLHGKTWEEKRAIICGEKPLRPSRRRMGHPQSSTSQTECRHAELAGGLKGDLDAIILKALQKEPRSRYPSGAALAQDLERHLAQQPVQARAEQRRARRRNVLIGILVPLLLILGATLLRQRATHNTVKPSIEGEELIVRRGQREEWRTHLPGLQHVDPLTYEFAGEPSIVVVEKPSGALSSRVQIYSATRDQDGTPVVLASAELPPDQALGRRFPDLTLTTFTAQVGTANIDGAPGDELYWVENGNPWYPSWINWWNPAQNTTARIFVNAGHIHHVLPVDRDHDGQDELVVLGLNNRLGYLPVVAILDWQDRPGETPGMRLSPDLARRDYMPTGLTYVPLHRTTRSSYPSTIVLTNEGMRIAQTWTLDRHGNPDGSPLHGTGRQARHAFWTDLAGLAYRLTYENDPRAAITSFFERHALMLQEPASRTAATIHLARRLAEEEHHLLATTLLADAQADDPADPADLQLLRAELLMIHSTHLPARERADQQAAAVQLAQDALSRESRMRTPYDAVLLLALHAILTGDRPLFERTLNASAYETEAAPTPPFMRGLRTLHDFCTGAFESERLSPTHTAQDTTPWTDVLRVWAGLAHGTVSPPTAAEAAALRERPETASLAALLDAWITIRNDADHRLALTLARPATARLEDQARTSYEHLAWYALGAHVTGNALAAAGDSDTAHELFGDAAAIAPACWFGTRADQSRSE